VVPGGWVVWYDDRGEYYVEDIGYRFVIDAGVCLCGENGESGRREPILQFFSWSALHTSVVWPLFLWYQQYLVMSAMEGLEVLRGGGMRSA